MKIILTGATGMVGEGVLLECLVHPQTEAILCVNRRPASRSHPKLKEYIVADFLALKTEMSFKKVYNFRPAFMKATPGQRNSLPMYKYTGWLYPLLKVIWPNALSTLKQVGLAMINAVIKGYHGNILEVKDIKALAKP